MTTTDIFLQKVRRTASTPDDTVPGDLDADLLAYADEEIQGRMLPMMMSNRDEFFVATKDYPIVASTSKYQIPSRAIGAKLRDVLYVVSGNIQNLVRIEPEDLASYVGQGPGAPTGFYLENANVVLVPTPSNSVGTLRLKYFSRPGTLVLPSVALVSTAVAVASGVCTVTVPAPLSQPYDIVSASSPFPIMAIDTVPGVVTGVSYAFAFTGETQAFANSQVNYLTNVGTSCVIQLPEELITALVQRTAARYLEAHGDREGASVCSQQADRLEGVAMALLAPRVDGEPKRVVGGLLFRGRNRGWFGS